MPNIKSAKKRVLVSRSSKVSNNDYRSSMRSAIKKLEKAVHDKDTKNTDALLLDAVKKIDKAQSKGVIKKNTASRYKSRVQLLVNNLK